MVVKLNNLLLITTYLNYDLNAIQNNYKHRLMTKIYRVLYITVLSFIHIKSKFKIIDKIYLSYMESTTE